MSKYLDRAKEIRAIVEPHHNCAQSVLMSFNKDAGIADELAYKMGACFGLGMKSGGTCGVVTGALMLLGLFGVDDNPTTKSLVDFFNQCRIVTVVGVHDFFVVLKELNKRCKYEKTEKFFKAHSLHQYFLNHGGSFMDALRNAAHSMKEKEETGRDHTYSQMAELFEALGIKQNDS